MIGQLLAKIPDDPVRRPGPGAVASTEAALSSRGEFSSSLAVLLQCVDTNRFTDEELTALDTIATERGVTTIRAGEFKRLLNPEFPVRAHEAKFAPFIFDWDQWVFNDVPAFMPLLRAFIAFHWEES